MSFLGLPLEIRFQIYREVLCPDDGVYLSWDWDRDRREQDNAKRSGIARWNSRNHDDLDDDDRDEFGKEYGPPSMIYPNTRLPISLMFVNRQIFIEASPILYSCNRFTFDAAPKFIIIFLKQLPSTTRSCIKSLGFVGSATAADDGSCTDHWDPLLLYINRHMHVSSVTIQVPGDQNHSIDESKDQGRDVNSEWYWWPAVKGLRDLLLEGKIDMLRLGHNATYLPEEGPESTNMRDAEGFTAINFLRYRRSKSEEDREYQEWVDFNQAEREGRSHEFGSLEDFLQQQLSRREKFDFVVTRVDDSPGDIGTVLVLRRPRTAV